MQWLKASGTVSLAAGTCSDQMRYSAVKGEWGTVMLTHIQEAQGADGPCW